MGAMVLGLALRPALLAGQERLEFLQRDDGRRARRSRSLGRAQACRRLHEPARGQCGRRPVKRRASLHDSYRAAAGHCCCCCCCFSRRTGLSAPMPAGSKGTPPRADDATTRPSFCPFVRGRVVCALRVFCCWLHLHAPFPQIEGVPRAESPFREGVSQKQASRVCALATIDAQPRSPYASSSLLLLLLLPQHEQAQSCRCCCC